MKKLLLFKLFALVACLWCAMGVRAQEAYVCYTSDNTTLTFYYDNLRSTRTGTTYDMNVTGQDPVWISGTGIFESLTKVVFDASFANFRPTTTRGWFFGFSKLRTITGIENLNTVDVTDMLAMFYLCSRLSSLDLSHFNTAKVTKMDNMFYGCSILTTIYVGSAWTTNAVTSSYDMFNGCYNLTGGKGTTYVDNHVDKAYAHIDGGPSNPGYLTDINAAPEAYANYTPSNKTLTFYYDNLRHLQSGTTYDLNQGYDNAPWLEYGEPGANTEHVVFDSSFTRARPTSTSCWFKDMTHLQDITGLNYLNTSQVTNMSFMFYNCQYLWSLDLSTFNTAKVTDMDYMFGKCYDLRSIDLSSFNTAKVTEMVGVFSDCENLIELDLSSFNTAKVSDMSSMFEGCEALRAVDLSNFSTDLLNYTENMFKGCGSLTTINVINDWYLQNVFISDDMFLDCTSIVGGKGTTYDASHVDKGYARIDGGPSNPGYFTGINAPAEPEAYACYTPSNTTLTFYYDDQRSTRTGTTYDLNTGDYHPDWYIGGISPSVTTVVFDPSFADARPISTVYWFYEMSNLQNITGLEYLNTDEVTNMKSMFSRCSSLTSIDLSGFNTAKVTDMWAMFYDTSGLLSLDLSSFNTANVNRTGYMFYNCSGLTSLDLSCFNTANVTSMYGMFFGCGNLVTIYVGENWSTANVTESGYMFWLCKKLKGGLGTGYNSDDVDKTRAHIDCGWENPGYLSSHLPAEPYAEYRSDYSMLAFYYDNARAFRPDITYDLNEGNSDPGWYEVRDSVTNVVFNQSFADARPSTGYGWFNEMRNLTTISGIQFLNTSNMTNMRNMFYQCRNLTSLDVSHFNTAQVTDMCAMFGDCGKLTSLDVSSFNTAQVTNMRQLFYYCTKLTSLDVSSFNTAQVKYMNYMFLGCYGLTSLDVSNFNTAQVKYMNRMFAECTNLVTIYVGDEWSTAAVTDSQDMFKSSTKIVGGMGTTYDASHVDAAYAHIDGGPSNPGYFTDINAPAEPEAYVCYTPENTTLTFYYDNQRRSNRSTTYGLNEGMDDPAWLSDGTYLSVTHVVFDPSFANARPTSTCCWFWGMQSLQSIDGMDCMNTEEVTTMWGMFLGCTSLTTVDVSSFDMGNVTTALGMFQDCSNLTTIYGNDGWRSAGSFTSVFMFDNCTSLVGGKGTTYDANHTNIVYAHIDGGPSDPGYFTAKGIRGDVNGDGDININDVTLLIDVVLGKNVTYNAAGADCNIEGGDGTIDINDVTKLISRVLTGNW